MNPKRSIEDLSAELINAVSHRQPNRGWVDRLLAQGADPRFKDPATGDTALLRACGRGDRKSARAFAHLSDLEARDGLGRTPLILAAISGSPELADALVDLGADCLARDNGGRSALDYAASSKSNRGMVRILAAAEAATAPGFVAPQTMLAACAYCREEETIVACVAGSEFARTPRGEDPATLLVPRGKARALAAVLDKWPDAKPAHPSISDRPLLSVAARNGFVDCIRVLLEHGADPFACERDGSTPLHAAVATLKSESVKILATPEAARARDKLGQTPLMLAASAYPGPESKAIVELLLPVSDLSQLSASGLDAAAFARSHRRFEASSAIEKFALDAELAPEASSEESPEPGPSRSGLRI